MSTNTKVKRFSRNLAESLAICEDSLLHQGIHAYIKVKFLYVWMYSYVLCSAFYTHAEVET